MFSLPSTARKFVRHLSRKRRQKPKKVTFQKGLNSGVITPNSNPKMGCAT